MKKVVAPAFFFFVYRTCTTVSIAPDRARYLHAILPAFDVPEKLDFYSNAASYGVTRFSVYESRASINFSEARNSSVLLFLL